MSCEVSCEVHSGSDFIVSNVFWVWHELDICDIGTLTQHFLISKIRRWRSPTPLSQREFGNPFDDMKRMFAPFPFRFLMIFICISKQTIFGARERCWILGPHNLKYRVTSLRGSKSNLDIFGRERFSIKQLLARPGPVTSARSSVSNTGDKARVIPHLADHTTADYTQIQLSIIAK